MFIFIIAADERGPHLNARICRPLKITQLSFVKGKSITNILVPTHNSECRKIEMQFISFFVGAHFACLGHAQSVANFLLGKTALLITKIGRMKKATNPSNPVLLNSCKIMFGPCPKSGNFLPGKNGLIDHKNRNNENEKCKKSKKYYNTLVRFLNFDLNLFLFKCF